MAKMTRGLKESQELNVEWLHRDARPLFTKFADWMHKPANASMAVVMLAAVGFVVPAIGDVMMILALAITAWALSKREGLDLRLPAQSGLIDPNNPMPNGAIGPAKGIFFLGNDMVRGSSSGSATTTAASTSWCSARPAPAKPRRSSASLRTP